MMCPLLMKVNELIILLYSYRFVIFRLSISTVDPLSIDISVIQGSILGPILFLCYINDFWRATQLFTALFADDGTALGKGKNLNELTSFVNSELQKISDWFRSNKIKTKFIEFRTVESLLAQLIV